MKNQIKALFLFSIFMLMSFHQVIPHAHHEHQEKKEEIAHHHSGEDHHHQDKKKKNNSGSFLSYLLAIHSHTTASSEILVLKEHSENFRFQKIEIKKKTEQEFYNAGWVLIGHEVRKLKFYHPPKHYFNPWLSIASLRGPPQLV